MKALKKILLTGAVLFSGSVLAGEAELVVSHADANNGSVINFDILNDANVTAFQFDMKLKGANLAIDTKDCLTGLPATHQGACNFSNGVLKVVVYSMQNADLASGPLGSISLNVPAEAVQEVSMGEVLMGTKEGAKVEAGTFVDSPAAVRKPFEQVGGTNRSIK